MFDQGHLGRLEYFNAVQEALPAKPEPPRVRTKAPYFTTWVRQQLVDRYGARRAFEGGLKITTTFDLVYWTQSCSLMSSACSLNSSRK